MGAIVVLLALLSGFIGPETGSGANEGFPPDASLFDSDRLLEVRIVMDPKDWNALRLEHHDLLAALGPSRLEKPEPDPYKTYRAEVTIDGALVKSVGVRKRGFIGSASSQRPSLGLRFDAFEPDQAFRGLKRMALNNNLQDPSQLHQLLAYRVFAKAGVASPRRSLARVTVNGKSLGLYSNVEPIESPFLKQHFGSSAGNLYEGQVSDFRPAWVKTFERKNHKDNPDRSDLDAVVRALESDDAHLLARLESVIDLDAYLNYWAVEALIGHWDSYSNNGNNFFVYRPPATGKFVFIPWGADSVFGDKDPFTPFETPESVKARSLLPRRLYQLPATRERYRTRLRHLLKTVWNESDLLEEVDRLQALAKEQTQATPYHFRTGLNKVRSFIRNRRAELEKELDGPAPEWNVPLKKGPCLEKAGSVTALFSTTWQKTRPRNPLTSGTVTLDLDLNGRRQTFTTTSAMIVPGEELRHEGHPTLSLLGLQPASLKMQVLILVIQPEIYRARTTLKVDGFSVAGVLLEGALWGQDFRILGLPVGTLKLQDAGLQPGAAVSGRLEADLYQLPE